MQEEGAEYLAAAAKRQRTDKDACKTAAAAAAAAADFDPTVVRGGRHGPGRARRCA